MQASGLGLQAFCRHWLIDLHGDPGGWSCLCPLCTNGAAESPNNPGRGGAGGWTPTGGPRAPLCDVPTALLKVMVSGSRPTPRV